MLMFHFRLKSDKKTCEVKVSALKHVEHKFRSLRKQHFDLVLQLDAMTKEADELQVKDALQHSATKAKSLMDSQEYSTQKFISLHLQELRAKMLTAVDNFNKFKRVIISRHDAQEQAKFEYMTKAE